MFDWKREIGGKCEIKRALAITVVWGYSDYGGSGAPSSGTYVNIFSTGSAFAALKEDGSITAWGSSILGVYIASIGGSFYKRDWVPISGTPSSGTYVNIFSMEGRFVALKEDGSIADWGGVGGSGAPSYGTYVNIFSTCCAFAALKDDGSITVWGMGDNATGDSTHGGSGAPTDGGYTTIVST